MISGRIIEGEILELDDIENYIHLKIKFNNFIQLFSILKENCDLLQMHKVINGTKITCFFLNNKLQRIFLGTPLYNNSEFFNRNENIILNEEKNKEFNNKIRRVKREIKKKIKEMKKMRKNNKK